MVKSGVSMTTDSDQNVHRLDGTTMGDMAAPGMTPGRETEPTTAESNAFNLNKNAQPSDVTDGANKPQATQEEDDDSEVTVVQIVQSAKMAASNQNLNAKPSLNQTGPRGSSTLPPSPPKRPSLGSRRSIGLYSRRSSRLLLLLLWLLLLLLLLLWW